MFADPLTISPDTLSPSATNPVTWDLVEATGRMRRRINNASTADLPENLVINHFVQGNEKVPTSLVDRHLVQFSRVERDTAGNPYTSIVNVTMSVPRIGLFTAAEMQRQIYLSCNFLLASGRVAALMAGQS